MCYITTAIDHHSHTQCMWPEISHYNFGNNLTIRHVFQGTLSISKARVHFSGTIHTHLTIVRISVALSQATNTRTNGTIEQSVFVARGHTGHGDQDESLVFRTPLLGQVTRLLLR